MKKSLVDLSGLRDLWKPLKPEKGFKKGYDFIVKLLAKSKLILAKSKLKSLPYNHTAHPATHNSKSSIYKSIQVLHQHMRYH